MEYVIIAFVALFTSGLTLFSGFGLGTLLLPAFALFFPIDTAIAMTAIVHFINNLFKMLFVGKYAEWKVVLLFGLPAIVAAFFGAKLLLLFSDLTPLFEYSLLGNVYYVTPIKLIIAILMLVFTLFEALPKLKDLSFDKKYLPLGGLLSGFFGGISGHQGALRSAFLIKYGLTKEGFIGTGVVIASVIDVSRLFVYSSRFALELNQANVSLLLTAIVAALIGVIVATRLLQKITMEFVQYTVSALLFIIAIALGSGII